jgi:hypothetical protein
LICVFCMRVELLLDFWRSKKKINFRKFFSVKISVVNEVMWNVAYLKIYYSRISYPSCLCSCWISPKKTICNVYLKLKPFSNIHKHLEKYWRISEFRRENENQRKKLSTSVVELFVLGLNEFPFSLLFFYVFFFIDL